jgi:predicted amidohydrolase
MQRFTAACVQFIVNPHNYEANIDKALHFIDKAIADHQPKLIVFPESITTGFGIDKNIEDFYNSIDFVPGRLTDAVCEKAAQEKVYIVWPTYERSIEKNVIYNSVLLINDEGLIVGKYRKTHLFPTERIENGGWSTPGNEVIVVDTPIAKIGLICCYDGDFPELSRSCALKGAEIIVRPSAFLRSFEIWELTNKARAYDNHVYMLSTNAVGPDAKGNNYFGHSMIVSPTAETLALCRGSEEIVATELDPNPLAYIGNGSKAPMLFNHIEDRNLSVYNNILQPAKSTFPRFPKQKEKVLAEQVK